MRFSSWCIFFLSLVAVLASLVCFETTSSAATAQNELNIYVSVSLTGPDQYEGQAIKQATELFIKAENNNGGLLGKSLKLIVQDDAGSVEKAGENAQAALLDPNHFFTIGSPYSRIALPVSKLYAKNGALYFTIFATNKDIGKQGPTIFQLSYNDVFQGEVLARLARKKFKAKKVLVITNRSDPYSEGLSDEFINNLKPLSEVAVTQFNFLKGSLKSRELVQYVLNIKPDLVFVPLLREEAAEIIKLLDQVKQPQMKVLGSDGWGVQTEVQSIIQSTLLNGDGRKYFYTFFWSPNINTLLNREIMHAYSMNSKQPYVAGVFTMELLSIVFSASKQSQELRPDLLAKYMRSRTWPGTTGNISFGFDGTTKRPIVLLELSKNGVVLNSVIDGLFLKSSNAH